ncbi:hypothetical protein [Terrabacter sp. C0L_2]|uniref:hypothetical protein n=1 Tax=Terrabacter sp. C0L_2 TaxID=3108389 RepID=UPI002ED5EE7C|nr:hypothetical protein U5C87_17780 [Terrabacter sp. C0L_2]
MAVSPDSVAVELGRPTPLSESDSARFQSWIDQALYLIGRRYSIDALNSADVDYVVLMAVAEHARHADSAKKVTVSVDDGNVSKEYDTPSSRVSIWDDLWDVLEPQVSGGGAFTIGPFGAPDRIGDGPTGWVR